MSLKGKRILIAKPGLDGHDIGAKIIAMALRDAGADVIYTGLRKTPQYIARVAIEEDVDALGLSILSGSHKELISETIGCLREMGDDSIKVFVGGTIPTEDHDSLLEAGASGVFTSDLALEEVVSAVDRALSESGEMNGSTA